jgi:hypothetical protein
MKRRLLPVLATWGPTVRQVHACVIAELTARGIDPTSWHDEQALEFARKFSGGWPALDVQVREEALRLIEEHGF